MGLIGRNKARKKREKEQRKDREEAVGLLMDKKGWSEQQALNFLSIGKAAKKGGKKTNTKQRRARVDAVLNDPDNPVRAANEVADAKEGVFAEGRAGKIARRDVKREDRQADRVDGAKKGRKKKLEDRFEKRNERLKKRQKRRKKIRDKIMGKPQDPAQEQQIGGSEEAEAEILGTADAAGQLAAAKADDAREAELLAGDRASRASERGVDQLLESAEQQQLGREGQVQLQDMLQSTPLLAEKQSQMAGERLREAQASAQAAGGDLAAILSQQVSGGEQFAAGAGAAVGQESRGRDAQLTALLGAQRGADLGQLRLGQQIEMAGLQNEIATRSKMLGGQRAIKEMNEKFMRELEFASLRNDVTVQKFRSGQKGKVGLAGGVAAFTGAAIGGAVSDDPTEGAELGGVVGDTVGGIIDDEVENRNK